MYFNPVEIVIFNRDLEQKNQVVLFFDMLFTFATCSASYVYSTQNNVKFDTKH